MALSSSTGAIGNLRLLTPFRSSPSVTTTRRSLPLARAEGQKCITRREGILGLMTGVTGLAVVEDALAAYGDPANVLGRPTDTSGFIPYVGNGYNLKIPSKWNPSPEREFEGIQVRYSDNADLSTHFIVVSKKTEKASISDYGSPGEFLKTIVKPLLGEQVFRGETSSEGGFEPNAVATADLLAEDEQEKNGKRYYSYEIFTRTADGDEGGKHQLFIASVGQGQLVILKVEVGDKRWFKGLKRTAMELVDSFSVA